jgi:glycosyltransferase involved in cell wall biosynthesis
LNVFPSQRLNLPAPKEVVRFYWYSQTIGSNRSLEILMEATAKIKAPFELHLRGSFNNDGYKKELVFLIDRLKLKDKVFFHEPILAEYIIKDASKFDVGLALESDVSQNRNICVTNKIFSYLMSGLAIIGTDTYGQKDIFTHFEEAVVLCKKNDVNDLSRAMLFYIQNHDKLLQAKTAAKRAAEERFNWECESGKLITHFEQSFFIKAKRQSIVNN